MKNIIFDLGSVILMDQPISVLNNVDIDNNTYDRLKDFFNDWDELDLGNKTLLEKYNEINFSSEFDVYKDRLVNYFLYREINIDMIDLLNNLKMKNYNIYVLSDNNIDAFNYYKNNEIFKNVDGWVMSCEYHTLKKDGKLFDILINNYCLEPNECYFIDDNIYNINEAKKHGIKGFVFNNNIDLLCVDMKNNGIII